MVYGGNRWQIIDESSSSSWVPRGTQCGVHKEPKSGFLSKPSTGIGSARNPAGLDQNGEDGEDHGNLRLGQPELYKQADREDPKALLDGVDVARLVGILRQLGDLAEYVSRVLI
ncbi:hypothetical protein SLEP1_g3699 [Rubroshorea leprosula]|uniref:Uncharacterized protein n=1 Tax=Rubroshorea leprosula TaxID=152421 RepID=A0AAV5HX23_9ROSI|nr:hypothetical protein SLEP1_g3699 [Rubroshorea leprosula]